MHPQNILAWKCFCQITTKHRLIIWTCAQIIWQYCKNVWNDDCPERTGFGWKAFWNFGK